MATLVQTWADDLNNLLSNADQAVQYQTVFFELKTWFLAAGWVLEFSGNGTTADASDNLPNAAAVVYGSEASQPISYFVVRSPDGWVSGGNVRILIYTNNANTDTTPTTVGAYYSNQVFALSGTPLTNRPTSPGEVTLSGVNNWAANFIPWASPLTGYWNAWRTTTGNLIFGVKVSGETVFRNFLMLTAQNDTGGVNGFGPWRFDIYMGGVASATNQLNWTELVTSANHRSFSEDGLTSVLSEFASTAEKLSAWPGGADGSGRVPRISVDSLVDSASDPRFMGTLVDVFGSPNFAPFNEVEDGDTDPQRFVCLSGLWVPATAADLPLL